MATLSWSTNWAISWHLQHSPDNPLAARQALTTLLRRKGRILDLLTQNQQLLRQQLEPENRALLAQLVTLNTQLTNLEYLKPEQITSPQEHRQQIEQLTRETQQLEAKLSRISSRFRVEAEPVTLETIQALIPDNTVLIEIVRYQTYDPKNNRWGSYRYGAYVLRSTGEPLGIDLGEAATIDDKVENFRLQLAQDIPIKQTKERGQILEKLVFAKIRPFLDQDEQILLSPDGELNLIPFEALVDENDNYLVENYRFTYLSSGRDLIRLAAHSPSMAPPVLMGNPNFVLSSSTVAQRGDSRYSPLSNIGWPKLPGTAKEIAEIAKLFDDAQIFTQEQANEFNLKQVQSPSILHLATHGFFVAPQQFSNPLAATGLALAGVQQRGDGDIENGLFTALEAVNLDLKGTQLIVLSACDTGLGTVETGEGIYGLRRSFVIAGSQTQIISLWRVDDQGTKDLMVDYYNKLLKEKKGRRQGLRELQLEMINGDKGDNYQHPYYWSSFILSGDSSSLQF
ncbi:CHAT domain-containing protein [Crocosphaera sp.]|uniref:CHAT domain-containing protein n=1 Tax=Crocosphaera sp. TaxID=2729996 RepID=UPI00262F7B2E|nr:CHAT domain-containing protein [Crocosphaera sp.]MDJ0583060.1 CHAT domain-containing protein [Crocosphaera sp.]